MQGSVITRILLSISLLFAVSSFATQMTRSTEQQPSAYLLNLTGALGPAAQDYLAKGINQAAKSNANFIIILLDTPGGLERSMRSMVSDILKSPIPIVTYVYPSGARAASAGTFILYASHIAAMAPGTNVGAATPISLTSGDEKKKDTKLTASEQKAINDASAYIRSLAQLRHRNKVWGEESVTKGASLSANEALQLKVIDLVALDQDDLLQKINNRSVMVQNKEYKINTAQLKVIKFSPDWRTRFLGIITDPNIAYILLLIGIYGIIFELLNPGMVLPGVAGVISLLIALYAFQLLPINYVGLGLILLGMSFIVAEVFVPSFGALGIGGVIAFIIGSIMLLDRNVPGFTLLLPVIIAVTLASVGFLIFIIQLAVRAHKKPIVSGREELIGSTGIVHILDDQEGLPRIRIRGELWQVRSNMPLREGQRVKVVGMEELILIVVPMNDSQQKEGNNP